MSGTSVKAGRGWGWVPVLGLAFALVISWALRHKASGPEPAEFTERGDPIHSPVPGAESQTPEVEADTAADPLDGRGEAVGGSGPSGGVAGAAGGMDHPEEDADLVVIGFDRLAAFAYELPDDDATAEESRGALLRQIPSPIRALDKRQVALKGFMLPLKLENGLVTRLLLLRDQSLCCFGVVPRLNEWVNVKMTGKGVKAVLDQPVTIFGQFHVEEVRENGYLVGIYALDGTQVAGPLDL